MSGFGVFWVGQEDADGCGIACLAMLTGRTYRQVRDELEAEPYTRQFAKGKVAREGMGEHVAEHYLWRAGFAWQRFYRVHFEPPYDADGNPDRRCTEDWPPLPTAPVHLASVVQPSGRAHFVVVTANGDVLDPLHKPAPTDEIELRDWTEVSYVLALWPVRSGEEEPDA